MYTTLKELKTRRVLITHVHPSDAYYRSRERINGKLIGEFTPDFRSDDNYFGGNFRSTTPQVYCGNLTFYKVRFKNL